MKFTVGWLKDYLEFDYSVEELCNKLTDIGLEVEKVLDPSKNLKDLFSKSRNINILSIARVFLFGSRDIWFVVGLPVFLYSNGWSFWQVGSFLALWTIGYGIVQSSIPSFIKRSKDGLSLEILSSKGWVILLVFTQLIVLIISIIFDFKTIGLDSVVVNGLLVFGALFAINYALIGVFFII